jgi:hypothetical protein
MSTMMDWLLQRQQRGYGKSQPSGPGVMEILAQSGQRGYPESPEMLQYRAQQLRNIPGMQPPALPPALPRELKPYGNELGIAPPAPPPALSRELMPYGNELGMRPPEPPPALSRELTPQRMNFNQLPGYEGEGMPTGVAARGRQVSQGPMGPTNMNVVKGLNQYAQMGGAQAYADQFAKGDLSKVKARTYRDQDGNAYNDYYVSGLLGG